MNEDINIGAISEALNNKVDLNQMNTNVQGLSYASGWGMPSDRYIDLTLGASGTTYTAPANGYFAISVSVPNTQNGGGVILRNKTRGLCSGGWNIWTRDAQCFLPVKKNDVIVYGSSESITKKYFVFIYAEGEQ